MVALYTVFDASVDPIVGCAEAVRNKKDEKKVKKKTE